MSNFDHDDELDQFESSPREKPALEDVLHKLRTRSSRSDDTLILYGLSDLTQEEVNALSEVWSQISAASRYQLMEQMLEISEKNVEFDYDAVALLAIHDDESAVRRIAVELLWENSSISLLDRLIELTTDEDIEVRLEATKSLGRFILLGELGELSDEDAIRAQNCVITLMNKETEGIDVRRRALESIANCSHPVVPGAIRTAYEQGDRLMRVSSVYAMGRTCDPVWEDYVLEEIKSHDPEMRYEAARASGEIQIQPAVPFLDAMLREEDDRELHEAAIWALGEIGGGGAVRALERAADIFEDDEDMMDAIDEALGNASLMNGDLMMFDIDDE